MKYSVSPQGAVKMSFIVMQKHLRLRHKLERHATATSERKTSEHLAVVQTTSTKSLCCGCDKVLKMSSDNV